MTFVAAHMWGPGYHAQYCITDVPFPSLAWPQWINFNAGNSFKNFPRHPLCDWVVPSFTTPHDPLLYNFLLLVIEIHYRTHQTTPPNLVVLVTVLINWNICAYIFPGQRWPCTASLGSGFLGRLWSLWGGHWEDPSTPPWCCGASRHVWGSWDSLTPLWRIHLKLEISLPSLPAVEEPQDCDVVCLSHVSLERLPFSSGDVAKALLCDGWFPSHLWLELHKLLGHFIVGALTQDPQYCPARLIHLASLAKEEPRCTWTLGRATSKQWERKGKGHSQQQNYNSML